MRILSLSLLFFLVLSKYSIAIDKHKPIHTHIDAVLGFKENKNQWNKNILYTAELRGANIFLEKNTITYVLYDRDDLEKLHPLEGNGIVHAHSYKVELLNANPNPEVVSEGESESYYNYFIGNNPSNWASNVHSYSTIQYRNIYPKIDLKFYFQNGLMKYDFILNPGADINSIQMKYIGADEVKKTSGNIEVLTSVGKVIEVAPISWQLNTQAEKNYINSSYKFSNNILSFNLDNNYNKSQVLIIDPTLIFSTYTGSTADNFGYTCTFDNDGNMYLGGYVNATFGLYPTTTGAFQLVFGGGDATGIGFPCDMGISKISSDGSTLIYSTYVGGSSNETPHSLFVNSNDQLIIYGRTYSADFPVSNNAYDQSFNGLGDITITILNTAGSAIIGSTFIGGSGDDGVNFSAQEFVGGSLKTNYGDDARGEVVADASGNIYVASCTFSSNFPVSNGAFQSSYAGNQDGCLFKLNANASSLIYSTYMGGSSPDACYSIDLKISDGSIYSAGGTSSSNFPSSNNGFHPNYLGGTMDGFLVHLSSNGTTLLNSTFLGTNDEDQAFAIKLDLDENVYVYGQTKGPYAITSGVYSNPNSGQFITKLDPVLNAELFSTVIGNGNGLTNISPTAFLVDTCENIYICGWGGSLGGIGGTWPFNNNEMLSMPITPDAFQTTTDGVDFYLAVLDKNAEALLYATYFGGNGAIEHVDGGTSRFNKEGVIYEAICAGCGGNSLTPTTPGVVSTTNNSNNCNELGFKMNLDLLILKANALADPAATGCAPLTVTFLNTSENAVLYHWDFGTGNPADTSNLFEPIFTFTIPGTYNVELIAYDPLGCVLSDTTYTTVIVLNTNASASFTSTQIDFCDSLVVSFNGSASGTNPTFAWNFGDGATSTIQNPSHTYTSGGSYTISLIITDDSSCNPLDTFTQVIDFVAGIRVSVDVDSVAGCLPFTVDFDAATYGDNLTYQWHFGDNTSSTDSTPSHTYNQVGEYLVMIVISNPGSCNGTDTAYMKVSVFPPGPTAAFSMSATITDGVTPIIFTNQSTGATSYIWDFGDGTISFQENEIHTFTHLGDYIVCLRASNDGPCADEVCKSLKVVFDPIIDVPNAFTPNGDGQNDILYVKGLGVKTFIFKVFNRWGEKVFETSDLAFGWDGIYKSMPQEVDVFAWTLSGQLDSGEIVNRAGNVTLLR